MPRYALKAVSRTAFAMALALAAGACSQGEQVFTRQNQAASALATMGMEAETKNAVSLDLIYAAETDLHEACAPLRHVAAQRMSGEDVGLDTQLVALVSMSRCETETRRVESFIWSGDPNIAKFYLAPVSTQTSLK